MMLAGLAASARAEELGLCKFDPERLAFAGAAAADQARCLLRKVSIGGDVDAKDAVLPEPLGTLIGTSITITKESLRDYLAARKIAEDDIGGSLDGPVSRAKSNAPDSPLAKYFVIHDTSVPNCSDPALKCAELGKLPKNRDKSSWPYNNKKLVLKKWNKETKTRYPVAHVYIGRTGISKTGIDFSTPWRAVRLESAIQDIPAKGLFLHIENVQPRVGKPAIPEAGAKLNDLIAPVPGFTAAQYQRLALVYVAASMRRGEWLIPGFHAVIDKGVGTHDDPQNFELEIWAASLRAVIADIEARKPPAIASSPDPSPTTAPRQARKRATKPRSQSSAPRVRGRDP